MPFNYENYINFVTPYFYLGFLIIILSVVTFGFSKRKWLPLFFLVAGNLIMSGTLSYMQPFLHLWDEQVHALVAKNMTNHPFKPMLVVSPHLDYSWKNWLANHIWLHKQPWFLWQIALFFKIFGINTFVLRLPDMLMFSGLLLITYRMGTIIYNKPAGFYAAVILAGSNFFYRLVTGVQATDHNDVAFVFYVSASFWSWLELEKSGKRHWLVLTGMFSGIAILNKWLPGLAVYSGWFASIVLSKTKRKNIDNYLQLLYASGITVAVALPWQIYILLRFPKESSYELGHFSQHFFSAVEGHSGNFMFHITNISNLYGTDFKYLILASLLSLFFIKIKNEYKIALITWIFTVYLFFSVAATKMAAFTFIVAPLVLITVSLSINYALKILFNQKNYLLKTVKPVVTVLVFGFILINFSHINDLILKNDHNTKNFYEKQIKKTIFYKKLPKLLNKGNYEFFNCPALDHIKVMFYTGYNAHDFLPTKNDIQKLIPQKITPVVFDDGMLPQYITENDKIIKIKKPL